MDPRTSAIIVCASGLAHVVLGTKDDRQRRYHLDDHELGVIPSLSMFIRVASRSLSLRSSPLTFSSPAPSLRPSLLRAREHHALPIGISTSKLSPHTRTSFEQIRLKRFVASSSPYNTRESLFLTQPLSDPLWHIVDSHRIQPPLVPLKEA